MKVSSLAYNGVTTAIPKSVLSVEYEHDGPAITQLIQTFLQNDKKIVAIHYHPSTNKSEIRLFAPNGTIASKTFVLGVLTMEMRSEEGVIKVGY